nr:MAG TPA: zinc-ribbon domain protein [Caudoviricetes sp.]
MIKENYYCCPKCGMKLFKLKDNYQVKNIEVYCRKCKKKIDVNL